MIAAPTGARSARLESRLARTPVTLVVLLALLLVAHAAHSPHLVHAVDAGHSADHGVHSIGATFAGVSLPELGLTDHADAAACGAEAGTTQRNLASFVMAPGIALHDAWSRGTQPLPVLRAWGCRSGAERLALPRVFRN